MKDRTLFQLALPGLVLLVLLTGTGTALSGSQGDLPALAWHTEIADVDGGTLPSLALDRAGRPHVAYGGNEAGTYEYGLKYAWYEGAIWHIEMVDDAVSPGWENSMALDAYDEPHIAYHDPHDALLYAHWYSGAWHIQTVDSGADVGEMASLAVDSSNWPHIAYSDETNDTIKYASRAGGTWAIEIVASFVDPSQQNSLALALDADDRPRLCFYDPEADTLRYAYKDGAAWQFETVDDDVFYNGQRCSIVMDSAGRPRIAYVDLGLWYAYRDGAGWHTTEIGHDLFGLSQVSLALDHLDRPHIAFGQWDYPDQLLSYARFNGLDWDIQNVDLAGETSRYEGVSLALDSADQPHIAYEDLGEADLKYAVDARPPIACRIYLPLVQRH